MGTGSWRVADWLGAALVRLLLRRRVFFGFACEYGVEYRL
jgi:hypothetical protein